MPERKRTRRYAELRAWSLAFLLAGACAVDNAGLGSGAGGAGAGATDGAAGTGGGPLGGVAGTAATAGSGGGGGPVPLGGESGRGATAGLGGNGAGGAVAGVGAGGGVGGLAGSGVAGTAGTTGPGSAGTGLAGIGGAGAGGEGGRGGNGPGGSGSSGSSGGNDPGGSGFGGFGARGGTGGSGFCGGCPGCMRCVNGACAVDPASLWKVRCVRATIAQTKPNGDAWDVGVGAATAPDPLCTFWLGNASAAETSVLADTFTPEWNESITPSSRFSGSLLSSQLTPWSIRVTDDDQVGFDPICSVNPALDAAAFSTGAVVFAPVASCLSLEIGLECVSQ